MKVLVIEDSENLVEVIRVSCNMRWPGTAFVSSSEGKKAAQLVKTEAPDVVLLDLGLPDGNGLDALREVRAFSEVPVLIITARSDEADRVKGLEIGADDYIVKPFSYAELLARIRAVLRRTQKPPPQREPVAQGQGLRIDLARHLVTLNGSEVRLTTKEWALLAALVRSKGKIVPLEALAHAVWGGNHLSRSTIAMCIRRLRLKLGDDPQNPRIVLAHHGAGYSFSMPS